MGKFRACPAATQPCFLEDPATGNPNWRRYGSAKRVCGPGIPTKYFFEDDYGSYGVNHWINTLEPGDDVWLDAPELHWKTDFSKNTSSIPILIAASVRGVVTVITQAGYAYITKTS